MEKLLGKSWLYTIFIAASIIASVRYVGEGYLSIALISAIQFWIAVLSIMFLTTITSLLVDSRVAGGLLYFFGMFIFAVSFGNLMNQYELSPFLDHTLNLNGLIASIAMIAVATFDIRISRPRKNFFKRNNKLVDESIS